MKTKKEPNLTDIKLRSEIPTNAKFIGWIIYSPFQDDFLMECQTNDYMVNKKWCAFPDMAMRFKKYKQARQALQQLNLLGQASLVAGFDVGEGIRIGN